ncbi:MAG: glutamate racemase [Pyrinomonadaceae bacterium]
MLGIIDWGIGGIGIYRLIRERLGFPVTYFSDTGVTPYGKMSRVELTGRLTRVMAFLRDRGVTHLAVGCNAASTAIPYLDRSGIQVVGMIEPAVNMTARLRPTRLALLGGRRTVTSGAYRRAFSAKGIEVQQRIAQPLSALIETGDIGSESLRNEARRILMPIRESSHILLACTHYPAIEPVLKTLVSPETRFIDPASEIVKIISRWTVDKAGDDIFLTSGDPKAMADAAKMAFGVSIKHPLCVRF